MKILTGKFPFFEFFVSCNKEFERKNMNNSYSLGIRPSFGMALKNTEVLADILSRSPKGKKIAKGIQKIRSRQANNPVDINIYIYEANNFSRNSLSQNNNRFAASVEGKDFPLVSGNIAKYFELTRGLRKAEKYADELNKREMKAKEIKDILLDKQ
ncbi:MAG: hypothetical protein LBK53_00625 [Heliobacteriaceae bacterium]|nr:hypothetical protein [Heliobacteriaceae bacterium]